MGTKYVNVSLWYCHVSFAQKTHANYNAWIQDMPCNELSPEVCEEILPFEKSIIVLWSFHKWIYRVLSCNWAVVVVDAFHNIMSQRPKSAKNTGAGKTVGCDHHHHGVLSWRDGRYTVSNLKFNLTECKDLCTSQSRCSMVFKIHILEIFSGHWENTMDIKLIKP